MLLEATTLLSFGCQIRMMSQKSLAFLIHKILGYGTAAINHHFKGFSFYKKGEKDKHTVNTQVYASVHECISQLFPLTV